MLNMEYNRIIAVTGVPGLFELMSSKTDGAIVRSLEDNSTRFVSRRVHNFSHLESIEVYTVRENVNLLEIFRAMQASKAQKPAEKDAKAIKAYFQEVFPSLDFERVYASDMKKMVKWYGIIEQANISLNAAVAAEPADVVLEEAPPVAVAEPTEKPKKASKKKASEA
jgi:hypothetical protein